MNDPHQTTPTASPEAGEVQASAEAHPAPESQPSDEQIRKVYVKDLKVGEALHTVFKATARERHTSRAGKPYLTFTLVDRTGEVEGRIFDNVSAAEEAFQDGDYLLVQGKVGHFHGKPQLIVEVLERLDPEPLDPAEFTFVAPPAPPEPAPEAREKEAKEQREKDVPAKEVRPAREPKEREPKDREEPSGGHRQARQRLLRLLDSPEVAVALDTLVHQLEKLIDERIERRLGGPRTERVERPEAVEPTERRERRERRARPKVEHRPAVEEDDRPPRPPPAPHRDPALPEGLAFKPFSQLAAEAPAAPGSGDKGS